MSTVFTTFHHSKCWIDIFPNKEGWGLGGEAWIQASDFGAQNSVLWICPPVDP